MKNLLWGALAALVLSGCNSFEKCGTVNHEVVVGKIDTPIVFDGKLDDAQWAKVPSYEFGYVDDVSEWPAAERNRIQIGRAHV